jgi:tetratricopeptide (TPR) repeat protein
MTLRRTHCFISLVLLGALTACPLRLLAAPLAADQEITYHVFMGELAAERGDNKTAAAEYLAAALASPDSALASHAAIVAYAAGNDAEALSAARRWQVLAPDSGDAAQFTAVMDTRLGDVAGAAAIFESQAKASHGHGFLSDAEMLEQESDAAHALPVLQRIATDEMQSADAHFALAHAAMNYKQYQSAEQEARAALALDSGSDQVTVLLCRALVAEGRAAEGLPLLKAKLAATPEDVTLHLAYGALLQEAGDDAGARREFEAILAVHPNDPQTLYTLGLLTLQDKDMGAARSYFMRLFKTGRRNDDASYFLGNVAELQKQYPTALEWYRRVADGDRWAAAQAGIGRSLVASGTPDAARSFFDDLVGDDPEDAVLLRETEAQVFSDSGDTASAIAVYGAALKTAPDNDDLLYGRAILLEQDGKADAAEQDLGSIIKRKPDDAAALNALGYTLTLHSTRYSEAQGYIAKALKLSPDDPAILDSMGWVDFRLGDNKSALTYLQKAYAAEADPEIAAHLIQVMLALGERGEARALLQKALLADPDDQTLKGLAPQTNP